MKNLRKPKKTSVAWFATRALASSGLSYYDRPFPSSKNPHFQNEAKCKTFVVNMRFICMRIKNHFHINGFALTLALKQRVEATRDIFS